ncbi:MAG: TetR/AcrR family transcriptional regulator [Polyangiales bacterium]
MTKRAPGGARVAEPEVRVRMASDARRAQLLALGLEMFSARSWDAVQIDDVAQAAGVSKGLLYHYFPTKRAFYAEVVREAARQLVEMCDTPESMPPHERLTTGLTRYLDFAERHAPAYVTLMRGGIGSDPVVAAIVEDTRRQLLARLQRAVGGDAPPPTLRLTLRGWLGLVEATSIDWLVTRELARDEVLALWVRALLALAPTA